MTSADTGSGFNARGLTLLAEEGDGSLPLAVVDKPAGLAVIPGRAESTSLLELLGQRLAIPSSGSTDPRVRVVHRIDKETSGVVLFARSLEAQRVLSEQFQNNLAAKTYLALVAGHPPDNEGVIDLPLGPNPRDPRRRSVVHGKGGRPALTHYIVLRRFKHYSFVELHPKTGKTHQLRVHLASLGTPIVMDPLYNRNAIPLMLSSVKRNYRPVPGKVERPLLDRLGLHAMRLELLGRVFEAPLPKDIQSAVNQLGKWG
jgi:23S rRNA pseudouridine1911/1915/1917 synthase